MAQVMHVTLNYKIINPISATDLNEMEYIEGK